MKKLIAWALFITIAVSVFSYWNWHYLMTEEERAEVLANRSARAEASEKAEAAKKRLQALKEEQRQKERLASYAPIMCEEFVKRRLKAPSTAEFQPSYQMKVIPASENEFVVTGYVDAQNGFGAMIRNRFVCQVQSIGHDNWRLTNISIQ